MSSNLLNPLLQPWITKYGLPPFDEIEAHHYKPAILNAFSVHIEEVKAIVDNEEAPSFENTICAYDKCGGLLKKILRVFYNLCSSDCPPDLQKVQLEMSAPLAEHKSAITCYPGLYSRISTVYENRLQNLSYNSEQLRLIERIHLDFVRGGARFDSEAKQEYKSIMMKLAELETEFSQNVLADETQYGLELQSGNDLSGLPSDLIDATRQVAVERGKPDSYIMTLSRSLVEPFLTYSDNRHLREIIFKAWINRGQMTADMMNNTCTGDNTIARNNQDVIKQILLLRNKQAKMHGYGNYADYATADTMAQNPSNVMDLLEKVWAPAKISCNNEKQEILDYMARHNIGTTLYILCVIIFISY
jgi:peptidyl-dipeptidase Dcp